LGFGRKCRGARAYETERRDEKEIGRMLNYVSKSIKRREMNDGTSIDAGDFETGYSK
jgi:hypothetical protein